MATTVGDVIARLTVDASGFTSGLDAAGARLRSFGSQLQSAGAGLSLGISAPLGAAAGAAVHFANQLETGITKIVNFGGMSREAVEQIRGPLNALAADVGKGPQELIDAFYFIAGNGIKGAAAMEVLTVAAKASAAGMGQTVDIARLLVGTMNAYQGSSLKAAEAGDILARATEVGGAEANELAGSMGRVVSVAASAGVGLAEAANFVASFTRQGVGAEEAVTSLRALLLGLSAPTPGVIEALRHLGTSVLEVRANLRDPSQGGKGLTETLIGLVQAAHGDVGALKELVPETRALAGVMATAGTQANQFRDSLQTIQGASSGVTEKFQNMKATTGQALSEISAKLQVFATQAGEQLQPAVKALVDFGKALLDMASQAVTAFAQLPVPIQEMVIGLTGLLIALGPVTFALGTLISSIGSMAGVASAAIGALAGIAAFLGTAGIIVVGAIAAAAALALVVYQLQQMSNAQLAAQQRTLQLEQQFKAQNEQMAGSGDVMRAMQAELDKTIDPGKRAELTKRLEEAKKALSPGAKPPEVTLGSGLTKSLTGPSTTVDAKPNEIANAVRAARQKLDTEFAAIDAKAKLLGPTFDPAKAKAEAYKKAIEELQGLGVPSTDKVFGELGRGFQQAHAQSEAFGRSKEALNLLQDLSREFAAIDAAEALFGDSLKAAEDRMREAESGIKRMIEAGYSPLSAEVLKFKHVYDQSAEAIRRQKAAIEIGDTAKTLANTLSESQSQLGLGLSEAQTPEETHTETLSALRREASALETAMQKLRQPEVYDPANDEARRVALQGLEEQHHRITEAIRQENQAYDITKVLKDLGDENALLAAQLGLVGLMPAEREKELEVLKQIHAFKATKGEDVGEADVARIRAAVTSNAALKQMLDRQKDPLGEFLKNSKSGWEQFQELALHGIEAVEDAFVKLFTTGKFDVKAFGQGLMEELSRGLTRTLFTEPLVGVARNFLGGVGSALGLTKTPEGGGGLAEAGSSVGSWIASILPTSLFPNAGKSWSDIVGSVAGGATGLAPTAGIASSALTTFTGAVVQATAALSAMAGGSSGGGAGGVGGSPASSLPAARAPLVAACSPPRRPSAASM